MEGAAVSFPGNHVNGTKAERKRNRKRKLSQTQNGSPETPQKRIKKRKSSKVEAKSENPERVRKKYLHFKETNDYVSVAAKPSRLPPPPQIFQANRLQNNRHVTSDQFLLSFLSGESACTEVSDRFRQNGVCEYEADLSKKEKKKKKNKKKFVKKKYVRDVEERVEEEEELLLETVATEVLPRENVEAVSAAEIYRVRGEKGLIFHMGHASWFTFQGEMRATIIMGEVEILGYTLSQSSSRKSVDVFAPYLCTPLVIEAKANNRQDHSREEVHAQLKALLSEEDCEALLGRLQPADSLLLAEQIVSDVGVVLNRYLDKVLFPKDLEDASSAWRTFKCLQSAVSLKPPSEERYVRKNPQWDKVPLGQCTAVCGGKGAGKSTLLRYYVNKLLAAGEKVLVVDLDPGQPEFTIPGCISAVVPQEPLIGPNFTHICDPVVMTCFGEENVSTNPTKYLECVSYIIRTCRQREELLQMKWLVNTMGFSRGLGAHLIVNILKLLTPNTVVQINFYDFRNNYPFFLTRGNLNGKEGFCSMPLGDSQLSHDLRVVSSCTDREHRLIQGGLRRRDLREIMSLAYFSRMVLPPFHNFNAVQPYLISFSKVYLGVDFLVLPRDILKAFNGNAVSLSHLEPEGKEEIFSLGESDYFQVVVKPPPCSCLGIGVVRGIDCEKKRFYVLTHLSAEVLQSVNCLSLRRVALPQCLFTMQETVKGKIAYTTKVREGIRSVRGMFRVPVPPHRIARSTERQDFVGK